MIITSEFHVSRSKVIFDWIFGVPRLGSHKRRRNTIMDNDNDNDNDDRNFVDDIPYEIFYYSTGNGDLSEDALQARNEREFASEANVRDNLAVQYGGSLTEVWEFLVQKHDFYSAKLMVKRSSTGDDDDDGDGGSVGAETAEALRISYGGGGLAAIVGSSPVGVDDGTGGWNINVFIQEVFLGSIIGYVIAIITLTMVGRWKRRNHLGDCHKESKLI